MSSKAKLSPLVKGLLIGGGILLLALAGVAVWLFGFYFPYEGARNTMDADGLVTIIQQQDDTLLVQWPAGENVDSYTLQVLQGDAVVFSATGTDTQCTLPALPGKGDYTLRIDSAHHYGDSVRMGEQAIIIKTNMEAPTVTAPKWSVDTRTGVLYLDAGLKAEDTCLLYYGAPDTQPIALGELGRYGAEFTFGDTGDFPIPEYGTPQAFWFELTTRQGQVVFQGKKTVCLELNREDFLGTELQLHHEVLPSNAYKLMWNETKGDHYEIHLSEDGENWSLLETVERTAPREYTTDYLPPFRNYHLRVTAVGGQTMPGSDYAAEPAVLEVKTAQRAVYSTMWPTKDLQVYAATDKAQELGKLYAGSAHCVLEEKDGMFAVRYQDGVGYVDSNYCMINLPEYMADLCCYDITNSYSSLYMVHEYGIAEVSGTIITGYEQIDLGDGNFVVPFLFPSAVKLVNAAQAALERGYRIKIYDSYRPNAATLDIYAKTEQILLNPVPVNTFSQKPVTDLNLLSWKPTPNTDPNAQPWVGVMEGLNYQILMTDNGRWGLNSFLAKGGSNHNKGVALDMTLVDAYGFELPMQTSIHDLSWYSETARNNENALLLKEIMTGNGFGGLSSEWWHFQDNDAIKNLKAPLLYGGVNLRCWMKDSIGWRYRLETGEYMRNSSCRIDGVIYSFDERGYVITE